METETASKGPLLVVLSYVLFLLVFPLVIAPVLGVMLAYSQLNQAFDWRRGHYEFMIRTFWISLPIFVVGLLTRDLGLGDLILFVLGLWFFLRMIVGLWRSFHRTALRDPRTPWL